MKMRKNVPDNVNDSPKRLLIIDDEANMRHMLSTLLKNSGYIVESAANGSRALQMVNQSRYDFILCDLKMPQMNGMDFLKAAKDSLKGTTVIMMSAYGTIDNAVEALKLGAYDYISKPFKTDEVLLALKKAEERERLKRENLWLKNRIKTIEQNHQFGNMIAKSSAMREVFHLAEKAAEYNTTILIRGESGTGKELVAKGIHFESVRSEMPLVSLNCGGIPENLLESELFGYKKGAFTGADRNKKGLFEEADGGTIFLDEIGEMPLSLQVKLLRVLQDYEIRPIGDSITKKINVRVIAATAKNLENAIREGIFREDLFYRLNVFQINLPPLRQRTEDIPILCQHFIQKFNARLEKDTQGIAPTAMAFLLEHQWPGNVRELENVIERATILAEKPILHLENFSIAPVRNSEVKLVDDFFEGYSIRAARKIVERNLIVKALRTTGGNRTKASRLLEISHPSLLSKMKAYDIM
ncbi:sigma-54-dependent transcriptional regulator [Thermodesulfobacteriota bacterium]